MTGGVENIEIKPTESFQNIVKNGDNVIGSAKKEIFSEKTHETYLNQGITKHEKILHFAQLSEKYYLKILKNRLSKNYEIDTNFEKDLFFDAVALSKNTLTDFLFEIKISPNGFLHQQNIEILLSKFEKINLEYKGKVGREYVLNLVIIFPKNRLNRMENIVERILNNSGYASRLPLQVEYIFIEDVEKYMIMENNYD